MSRPIAVFLISSLLTVGSAPASAQARTIDKPMCEPALFGSDNSLFDTRYPVADEAFDKQQYRLAFRAYYQYFFCLDTGLGVGESINPAAEDCGAANYLRLAIEAASTRRYPSALTLAESALKVDARLGEAQFIIGDIDWILQRRTAAHSYWGAAMANSGYPEPPHDITRESALSQAARQMLRRHR